MQRSSRVIQILIIVTVIAVLRFSPGSTVQAQSSIVFSETEIENRFPDEIIFRVTASSTGADISSAKFAFTINSLYGSKSYTKDPIEFTPGPTATLEYTLDTRDLTTPPMMTYLYHWEVVDAEGNKVQSEEVLFRYDDNRQDWQVLENEGIAVWWHDRSAVFGQTIFDIAEDAVTHQQELFQAELDFQMKIVISNTQEEFNSWHNIGHDWIGGQTFSNFGITNQIVEGEYYQDAWLNGVIPHEISHIFFNHVVYNPTVLVPVWLNEGVAQYNEFITHEWEMDLVENAAANDSLVPLAALEDGFGSYNVDRIYLSYAEAYSAAAYLVETYGNEGLSSLLAAYQGGKRSEEAFPTALGISLDQFEMDWAESVGAENYLLPTVWAIPTFRPSPTAFILEEQGTPDPGQPPAVTPAPPARESSEQDPARLSAPIPLMLIALVIIFLIFGGGAVAVLYFIIRKEPS